MLDYEDQLTNLYRDKETFLKRLPNLSPLIHGWFAPDKIEIKGNDLIYRVEDNKGLIRPDQKTMRQEVLAGFLRLAEATDEEILEYASKWGVLGLCEHGLPMAHSLKPIQNHHIAESEDFGCKRTKKRGWFYEPLDKWRYYSRQVSAIVRLSVDLRKSTTTDEEYEALMLTVEEFEKADHKGQKDGLRFPRLFSYMPAEHGRTKTPVLEISPRVAGNREDWELVYQDFETGYHVHDFSGANAGRIAFSSVINRLLGITGVRPYFSWHDLGTDYDIALTLQSSLYSGYIFPILAVQLMLLVSGAPDYAICYSCHKPFFLRKGQSIGMRAYCMDCGTKAARREATKKYYHQERTNKARQKRKRLTLKQVEAIQRAFRKPKPGLVKELAKKYGVSTWAIYKIREGKTWNKDE